MNSSSDINNVSRSSSPAPNTLDNDEDFENYGYALPHSLFQSPPERVEGNSASSITDDLEQAAIYLTSKSSLLLHCLFLFFSLLNLSLTALN